MVMVRPAICGAARFVDRLTADSRGAETVALLIAKSIDDVASGSSLVAKLLRAQTPMRYEGFAVAGVQVNVVCVDQPVTADHEPPSCTSHLYCTGPLPPWAAAVKVTAVPGACGAGLFDVNDTDWTGTLGKKGKLIERPLRGAFVFFGAPPYVHMGVLVKPLRSKGWHVIAFGHQGAPDENTLPVLLAYFKERGHPGYAFRDLTR